MGTFYGTAACGGGFLTCGGTIFRLTTTGDFAVIHFFTNDEKGEPSWGVIEGSDGFLYGTNVGNGGSVFRVRKDGEQFETLHEFVNTGSTGQPDPSVPGANLVEATDGYFYGMTERGGTDFSRGTIFRIATDSTFEIVHPFADADGTLPWAASLIQGFDGKLYGTNSHGGPFGAGVVFRLDVGAPPIENPCTPPTIATQPVSQLISSGAAVTLSIAAVGTNPLAYEWFVGAVGNTSTLIGTSPSITVSPTSTTSYWVRVSNECDWVNSAVAVVTVQGNPQPPIVFATITGPFLTENLALTAALNLTTLVTSKEGVPIAAAGIFIDGVRVGQTNTQGQHVYQLPVTAIAAGSVALSVRADTTSNHSAEITLQAYNARSVTVCFATNIVNINPTDFLIPQGPKLLSVLKEVISNVGLLLKFGEASGQETKDMTVDISEFTATNAAPAFAVRTRVYQGNELIAETIYWSATKPDITHYKLRNFLCGTPIPA